MYENLLYYFISIFEFIPLFHIIALIPLTLDTQATSALYFLISTFIALIQILVLALIGATDWNLWLLLCAQVIVYYYSFYKIFRIKVLKKSN